WGGPPYAAFEYWSHAACVLPIEDWPNFEWRRQQIRQRGRRWHWLQDAEKTIPEILKRLADGPLTANELGGAKKGGVWWDWSETKIAVEWLLDVGEVVCTRRKGFQRVYDLPERAVPAELLDCGRDPAEQRCNLLRKAAAALGVVTVKDLAAYTGMSVKTLPPLMSELGLLQVKVEGWGKPAWAVPAALENVPAPRRTPVLLSPFDSLIWERDRIERLFGFVYRLEAYTPKPKRIHGYCSLPVLAGGELVGRVDPGRETVGQSKATIFVGKGVHIEPALMSRPAAAAAACLATAEAMWEAASWVGAEDVRVDWVTPDQARPLILAAVRTSRP
ncbi:MAG TPA: crosslink repair DNA glycosylase YcaQ family protein, partial [Acidimicrobiales bacterium]|nr:crosslink repair DNA glycosylase YcaQ family protein [Acidimicrobiales bacterium]